MDGYVKNISSSWLHAMKRSIGPGAQVPLKELYEQYGLKHDLKEGEEFVSWLKNVKLRDHSKWKVEFNSADTEACNEEAKEPEEAKPAPRFKRGLDGVAPLVATKTTVADIVALSVRQSREVLPKVTDLNLLKYALQEANQLSGKDSLCRIIRKRIREIQIAR